MNIWEWGYWKILIIDVSEHSLIIYYALKNNKQGGQNH